MKNYSVLVSAFVLMTLSFAPGCTKQDTTFMPIGQYHDSSNDRVFAVTYKPQTTAEAMRVYGMHSTNTSGRMTAVYFLPEGSQDQGAALKAASSVEQAIAAVAGNTAHAFVYQRATNGKEAFVNCSDNPTHELCQKQ